MQSEFVAEIWTTERWHTVDHLYFSHKYRPGYIIILFTPIKHAKLSMADKLLRLSYRLGCMWQQLSSVPFRTWPQLCLLYYLHHDRDVVLWPTTQRHCLHNKHRTRTAGVTFLRIANTTMLVILCKTLYYKEKVEFATFYSLF